MEKLRDEILLAESTRSDLLKWRLALVGAIGAAGLGFAGAAELRHADVVLCALPPVTTYVDLLARHLTLRILVIGAFLRSERAEETTYRAYEEFAEWARSMDGRGSAFALEDWALKYSSYGLSAAVAGYGVYQLVALDSTYGVPFVVSGVIGGIVAALGNHLYQRRAHALAGVAPPGDDRSA
jgi:hypothetical protein